MFKTSQDTKYYLINKMFSGDYLKKGNIGHEIINFYLDDEGRNYIYVTNNGAVKKSEKIECIFLARYRVKGCLEILGVAKELEPLDEKIDEYIENERKKSPDTLRYNGIDYRDIFKTNKWDSKDKEKSQKNDEAHYLTFRSKEFLCPKAPILIFGKDYKPMIGEKITYFLADKVFGTQSPKLYVENKGHKKSFKVLTDLIENEDLWEKTNRKYPNQICDASKEKQGLDNLQTYLHIMQKTDSELIFSNMLAHFLRNNPKMMSKFCDKVLEIKNISENAEIEREHEHIDLYIRDENKTSITIAAIENKIKSGINGVYGYRKNDQIKSQLSVYHDLVKKEIEKAHKPVENAAFFIFAPKYRERELNKDTLKAYKNGKDYKIIYYDTIYNFFKNYYKDDKEHEKYYYEFVRALEIHVGDYRDDAFVEMQSRFLKAIQDKKAIV